MEFVSLVNAYLLKAIKFQYPLIWWPKLWLKLRKEFFYYMMLIKLLLLQCWIFKNNNDKNKKQQMAEYGWLGYPHRYNRR